MNGWRTGDRSPSGGPWTYAEYMRLPVESTRYEVVAGHLYVTPSPSVLHQEVVAALLLRLRRYVEGSAKLGWVLPGPVDLLLTQSDFIEPDIVFVSSHRRHILSERGIEEDPDLVIEIVSPETAGRDRGIKRDLYLRSAVSEYWIVDAAARDVEICRVADGRSELTPRVRQWRWQPDTCIPPLLLEMDDVLEEHDEMLMRFHATAADGKNAEFIHPS